MRRSGQNDESAPYCAPVDEFVRAQPNAVLGALTRSHAFSTLDATQTRAWAEEIEILQSALLDLGGWLYLEFDVPRLGSRIDAVLVTGGGVLPLEFKVGDHRFTTDGYNQVWDYALDLKNFHRASHDVTILPILVATRANLGDPEWGEPAPDSVWPPRRVAPRELRAALLEGIALAGPQNIDGEAWGRAPYSPTPTIIQAAQALYARHTVEAITRNDAGARNLRVTSAAVEEIIERSRRDREKSIVFVTGVPGAGKTLVGLNVATRRRTLGEARAVFLSGNAPLVAVLREALTRDEFARLAKKERKGLIRQKVKPFIQNVHHFRDEGLRTDAAPYDHVVIFDEAQRAWNREKTVDFMKRRKGRPHFNQSEPEFLISYLDRHAEWAVVVCLVGGGQEIHTGEAGIAAWCDAVQTRFPHWRSYISPNLADSEYAAGSAMKSLADVGRVDEDDRLHLASSMRSFRSERVSAFVKALLDRDVQSAQVLLHQVSGRYPIVLTRDLARAKAWVRQRARGSEQFGLVASSQAMRLKPHAVDVRVSIDPIHWFLGDRSDTRSCYYLEDAATEFQVQGLEVDWTCVTWDADLRFQNDSWHCHAFRGDGWTKIHKTERRRNLQNAYRVLLTRARQGMVIFVPPGDSADATRAPSYYDGTFSYLCSVGVPVLD